MRNLCATAINEILSIRNVPTAHGNQFGIARISDGLPIFLGYACASEDTPTTNFLTHAYMK